MGNILGTFSNILFGALGAAIFVLLAYRVACFLYKKESREQAIVCDKQTFERTVYRKSGAPYVKREFCVTWVCGRKKRIFDVSEETYNKYSIGECGILRFRGGKLMNFERRG